MSKSPVKATQTLDEYHLTRELTPVEEILSTFESLKSSQQQLSNNDIVSVLYASKRIAKDKKFIDKLIFLYTQIKVNKPNTNVLSDREIQVLKLVGKGKESKAIAKLLELKISTIETHRKNIRKKLNLKGNGKLLQFAIVYNLMNR